MRNLTGIERVIDKLEHDLIGMSYDWCLPMSIEQLKITQEIIEQMTIGQLFALTILGERLNKLTLISRDKDGTVYLTISGLYGGMDTEGFIHT